MKKLIAMICFVFAGAALGGEPYGTDVEQNRLVPNVPAVMVELLPDHTMVASHIKVADLTDGKPLLCFKDPDKQLVDCFEVNVKTGQVVFVQVPTDEKSI